MRAWPCVPIRSTYLGLFDGPHATPKPSDCGPVFLGIGNITADGHLDLTDVRHIAEEDFPAWTKRVVPQAGDIVFTYEATLNRYAIIPEWFRGCLGRRTALIRPNPTVVDGRWLYYYFFGAEWRSVVSANTLSGATVDRIPLAKFPAFPISLPPLETQARIASILSAYDDLIENNTRRIAILEEMARRIYEEWFVHFRFPGHEKVRMVESELGLVPEGWRIHQLFELAEVNARSVRRGSEPPQILYVDIASVVPGLITGKQPFRFDEAPGRARRVVGHGDIIWSCVRPNRRSFALVVNPEPNLIVSTGFAVVTPRTVPFSYLYFARSTDDFVGYLVNHATGAAYPAVTARDFETGCVLLPATELLARFHAATEPMLLLCDTLRKRNVNLRTTRDALLPKLISGELDVSEMPEPESLAA